jgi:Ca-activated chloride channel homolog
MQYLRLASNVAAANGDQGIERLIIAIDVSPSMESTDWPPSRLKAAQEAAIALIQRKVELGLGRDEVGIVAFADMTVVCCRPLRVASHTRELADAIGSLKVGNGTNIAAALEASGRLLLPWPRWFRRTRSSPNDNDAPTQHRIIALTDGDHNVGKDPRPVARSLRRAGACIDCIGIAARSDVNENLLRSIASKDQHTGEHRYIFIGDRVQLIERFRQLAGRISR